MGWSPFWEDDEEEAARIAAEQAGYMGAAKDFVSKEASRLEAEYTAKYEAAQLSFLEKQRELESTASQLGEKQNQLDEYAKGVTSQIQLFNQSGKEAAIAAKNVGTTESYAIPTQPIEEKGPDLTLYLAVGALAYLMFFRKRR